MANTKGNVVTDIEASSLTLSNATEASQFERVVVLKESFAAMAANDTHELLVLPSSARITDILIAHDALGTTLTLDIGIGTRNAGAAPTAVDADILVDGYDAAAAQIGWLTILGLGNVDPQNIGKQLWELAGATSDPNTEYVVYATAVTSGTPTAGDVPLKFFIQSAVGI